ncbi:MAG: hypothetical protein QNJ62_11470 [Methyloceanibacter sp.]|nr:hypothetical protein [Methyloceanibacter sp.]
MPLVACLAGWMPSIAQAELKDYQIARLIMLKSGCQLSVLLRSVKADGSVAFTGKCKNATHYPDLIIVFCPDLDSNDERSCEIKTNKKSFDNLQLLQSQDE